MPDNVLLALIAGVAVVGIRLGVWCIPEVDVKMFRTVIHHFWFGIFFMVLSFPLSAINHTLGVVALGVGLGLAADELVFMLRGGGRDKQYWTAPSILGALILLVSIFYFQTSLVSFLFT
ncbi:hypothetical protein K2Q00_04070 [Patescibacteria group bacterium]|nr:hypothetical protein [Patescibacteria group bacterium]